MQIMEEFDRYKQLKYILLWLGIPSGTIIFLRYFNITDVTIILLSVIIVVILVSNYMKEKEIEHLKKQIEELEKANGKKKKK